MPPRKKVTRTISALRCKKAAAKRSDSVETQNVSSGEDDGNDGLSTRTRQSILECVEDFEMGERAAKASKKKKPAAGAGEAEETTKKRKMEEEEEEDFNTTTAEQLGKKRKLGLAARRAAFRKRLLGEDGEEEEVEEEEEDEEEEDDDDFDKAHEEEEEDEGEDEDADFAGFDNDAAGLVFDPEALDKVLQLPSSSDSGGWCQDESYGTLQFGPTFQVGGGKLLLKIMDVVLYNKTDPDATRYVSRKLLIMKKYYNKSEKKFDYFTVDITRINMREFMHGTCGLIKMVEKSEAPSMEGFLKRTKEHLEVRVKNTKEHEGDVDVKKAGARRRIL